MCTFFFSISYTFMCLKEDIFSLSPSGIHVVKNMVKRQTRGWAPGDCCTSTCWEWRLWWQQLETLLSLGFSQSLLILTHDSPVCFVPCLADGPESSPDQEGAVPPYPSSASAFPLLGLSLSARHHYPFIWTHYPESSSQLVLLDMLVVFVLQDCSKEM